VQPGGLFSGARVHESCSIEVEYSRSISLVDGSWLTSWKDDINAESLSPPEKRGQRRIVVDRKKQSAVKRREMKKNLRLSIRVTPSGGLVCSLTRLRP
jgi:hypothetical protein